jgi:hypothetical protein
MTIFSLGLAEKISHVKAQKDAKGKVIINLVPGNGKW